MTYGYRVPVAAHEERMVEKHLLRRRTVIKGAATLAAAGAISGLRSRPSLAQAAPGVTDSEVLIGALGQLTGAFAFIGAPGRDNMQMAVDKLNEAGGINGRKLRLLFEHASTPAESVAAAKKLVENDKVFVLVIATGSTGAAAAADYVRSARSPPTIPWARRRSSVSRLPATSFTAR